MSKPIKPEEVGATKISHIPALVFEVFNSEISRKFSNGFAIIQQEDVVEKLIQSGMDRNEIFDKGWLNVEEAYRDVGWTVSYDKPGFNETYAASFGFEPKRRRTMKKS